MLPSMKSDDTLSAVDSSKILYNAGIMKSYEQNYEQ